MSSRSNSRIGDELDVDLVCEGVVVGHGSIRSIVGGRAFVRIRDFPLGANSFLELAIDPRKGAPVSIPVRLIENTGTELEVMLEGTEPTLLASLLSG